MKKFYTSNYSRNGQHKMALAISAQPPEYYYGIRAPELAPTWTILNAELTPKQHEVEYFKLLEQERKLTPQHIVDRYDDGAIFLCYESPFDFCHRHVFAKWINQSGLATVEEILTSSEKSAQSQKDFVDNILQF